MKTSPALDFGALIAHLEEDKVLGRRGGILLAGSFVLSITIGLIGMLSPGLDWLTNIILLVVGSPILALMYILGSVFILLVLQSFAQFYREGKIFRNGLFGFMFGVEGVIAAMGFFYISYYVPTFRFVSNVIPPLIMGDVADSMVFYIVLSGISFVSLLFSSIFYRRTFIILSTKSHVERFRKVGLLLLIGSLLMIDFSIASLSLVPLSIVCYYLYAQTITLESVWMPNQVLFVPILVGIMLFSIAWTLFSNNIHLIKGT